MNIRTFYVFLLVAALTVISPAGLSADNPGSGLSVHNLQAVAEDNRESQLRLAPTAVSEDGRRLLDEAGRPFLWIGDTAWDLHHRLTREEIRRYLDNRQQKGFTVILFRIPLAETDGEAEAHNRYGHVPFLDKDLSRPSDEFFQLVDYTLDEMEKRGLVAGFLPLWGYVIGNKHGFNPSEEDVVAYAQWLSERYRDRGNIVWVTGGDTGPSKKWGILGSELKKADPAKLVTFHPGRQRISSYHLFGDAPWLDFHMTQTGHTPDLATNYLTVNEVYQESSKPILNGEPAYEDIRAGQGIFITPHQVRKAAYWSLLAGGFGHVYGHTDIFQFAGAMPGQAATWGSRDTWKNALDDPGAQQIAVLSMLLRTIPWPEYEPKQELIAAGNAEGPAHMRAAATPDGGAALVYLPEQRTVPIRLAELQGPLSARWFDPQTGHVQNAGTFEATGTQRFTPPFGPDALLVLVSRQSTLDPR